MWPDLSAEGERRLAGRRGQTQSDAAIVSRMNASDVPECHRPADLPTARFNSGRRGRQFKSGHIDD